MVAAMLDEVIFTLGIQSQLELSITQRIWHLEGSRLVRV